jgi:HEPN domain-containing protein
VGCLRRPASGGEGFEGLGVCPGGEGRGHSLLRLVEGLRQRVEVPQAVQEAARNLDRHSIPARYPDGWPAGAPGDFYDRKEAEEALSDAETILTFARGHLS